MVVEWLQDNSYFVVGVWVVEHLNSAILRDRLLESGPKFYEQTRAMIKSNLGGASEDDIAMDTLKISLICPVCDSTFDQQLTLFSCLVSK
jgi:hypothetical protein